MQGNDKNKRESNGKIKKAYSKPDFVHEDYLVVYAGSPGCPEVVEPFTFSLEPNCK